MLREACRQAAHWPDLALHRGECLTGSVPSRRLRRSGQTRCCEQSGLAAGRLEIEITEGVLLHETDETLATLHRLRELGVSIAMDDFGTGYSSLGYLQKFRFDKIKIDRSFVQNLQADGTVRRSCVPCSG